MKQKIKAYAVSSLGGALSPFTYEGVDLGAFKVEIDITHCGVCHTDAHLVDGDWSIGRFPLVPGHEIIGFVSGLGSEVRNLALGQRVGVGWQCYACWDCELCMSGNDHLCLQRKSTCVQGYGGFADRIQVDSRLVFAIPDGLSSEAAAPLLCAGITVFAPLVRFGVTFGTKVGVSGIGGLGHLAIQFAAALGAEVTAYSSTSEKEKEAVCFGAKQFLRVNSKGDLKRTESLLDFLIVTSSSAFDVDSYLSQLRPCGSLCLVGMSTQALEFSGASLILKQKSIVGSPIGSRAMMYRMLKFANERKVAPKTEIMKMSEANHALKKVKNNQARYRIVLEN